MKNIFKVHILKGEETKEIHVFYKSSIFNLFRESPDAVEIKEIFSEDELDYIKKRKISVKFHDIIIRQDDSIDIIKKKLVIALENTVSMDEMYLFSIFTFWHFWQKKL